MKTRRVGTTAPEAEVKRGPSFWQASRDAATIDSWPAVDVAKCVERGWIAEWPFEVTRLGRWELRRRPGEEPSTP